MAKFTVVNEFRDLDDVLENGLNHIYRVGDKYPRTGRAKTERLEELSTKKNKQKKVLIKELDEEENPAKVEKKEVEKVEEPTKEVADK